MKHIAKSFSLGLLWWAFASGILIFMLDVRDNYLNQQRDFLIEQPMENWVQYDNIEPLNKLLVIGEEVYFKSYSEVKQISHIEWEDILMCDLDEKTQGYFSVYKSSNVNTSIADNTEKPKVWRYGAPTPTFPTECQLVSNISLLLPYDVKKKKTHTSEPFKFIAP